MSDMMEKLLKDEQNTDEKFVAAANFFMKLKEKTKEARYAKPAAAKPKAKKLKAEAAAGAKSIVRQGGAVPVKMQRAKVTSIKSAPGQANVVEGRAGYKKIKQDTKVAPVKVNAKPKKTRVVVKIAEMSDAEKKEELQRLVKQAMFVRTLTGLVDAGRAAKGRVVAKASKRTKDFKQGYQSDGRSALGNFAKNTGDTIKQTFGIGKPGATTEFFNTVGSTFGAPGLGTVGSQKVKGFKNLFRNSDLVKLEKKLDGKVIAYKNKNMPVGDAATPKAMAKYEKGLAKLEAKNAQRLADFNSGQNMRIGTGLPETQKSVMQAITGPDGKIGVKSVMQGARDLGVLDTAALVNMGLSGKASMDAARAARAATDKSNAMKMGLAGAAGLGGLYLLKNRKANNSPQNVS